MGSIQIDQPLDGQLHLRAIEAALRRILIAVEQESPCLPDDCQVTPHAAPTRDGFSVEVTVEVGVLRKLPAHLYQSVPIPGLAEFIRIGQTALGKHVYVKEDGCHVEISRYAPQLTSAPSDRFQGHGRKHPGVNSVFGNVGPKIREKAHPGQSPPVDQGQLGHVRHGATGPHGQKLIDACTVTRHKQIDLNVGVESFKGHSPLLQPFIPRGGVIGVMHVAHHRLRHHPGCRQHHQRQCHNAAFHRMKSHILISFLRLDLLFVFATGSAT